MSEAGQKFSLRYVYFDKIFAVIVVKLIEESFLLKNIKNNQIKKHRLELKD